MITIDPIIAGAIGFLFTAFQGAEGLVYRELRQQITDKDARIATLEREAKEAVVAVQAKNAEELRVKDEEMREWRRLALARMGAPSP